MKKVIRRHFNEKDRQDVQEEVSSIVESNPEKFIALYKQLDQSYGGRYINSDVMKEVLPHFANNEERNRYNVVVHNSAAALTAEVLEKKLAEEQQAGRGDEVVTLFTGVPGAGKSIIIQTVMKEKVRQGEDIPLVYEGQMANIEVAREKVQQVLDAGFRPRIVAVHNAAIGAFENTLRRFAETGRGGSIDLLATILGNLPEALKKIEKEYGNSVQLVIVDKRDLANPAEWHGWEYRYILESEGNYEQIKKRLYEYLEQLKHEGRISPVAEAQARGNV